jgi:tetratricopeptide (TPR) repeat protein
VDIINAYGEVLVFMQKEQEAGTFFDKALNINKESPSVLLNKAVLIMNSMAMGGAHLASMKGQAIQYLEKAVQVDPKFETAHLQLGNLLLGEGKTESAFIHFDEAIRYARTLPELISIESVVIASRAQVEVGKRYPVLAEQFKSLVQGRVQ